MSRTTAVLAGLFFFISLTLGALTANKESAEDEWENLEVPAVVEAPVQTPADQDVPMGEVPESAIDDVPQVDKSSDVPN